MGNQWLSWNYHSRWPRPESSARTIHESKNLASNVVSEPLPKHGMEVDASLEILTAGGPDLKFQYEQSANPTNFHRILSPNIFLNTVRKSLSPAKFSQQVAPTSNFNTNNKSNKVASNVISEPLAEHGHWKRWPFWNSYNRWPQPEMLMRKISESKKLASHVVSEPLSEHGIGSRWLSWNSYSRWPRPEISIRTISASNKFASNVISEPLSEHGIGSRWLSWNSHSTWSQPKNSMRTISTPNETLKVISESFPQHGIGSR